MLGFTRRDKTHKNQKQHKFQRCGQNSKDVKVKLSESLDANQTKIGEIKDLRLGSHEATKEQEDIKEKV